MKRDFDQLERRRLRATDLFAAGLNNSEIGRRMNVPNQTVSRWRKQFQTGGVKALEKAGRAVRMPLLNAGQLQRLVEILRDGPGPYGYKNPLWTCNRVACVIEKEFGVKYHSRHVWKIWRKLES